MKRTRNVNKEQLEQMLRVSEERVAVLSSEI